MFSSNDAQQRLEPRQTNIQSTVRPLSMVGTVGNQAHLANTVESRDLGPKNVYNRVPISFGMAAKRPKCSLARGGGGHSVSSSGGERPSTRQPLEPVACSMLTLE